MCSKGVQRASSYNGAGCALSHLLLKILAWNYNFWIIFGALHLKKRKSVSPKVHSCNCPCLSNISLCSHFLERLCDTKYGLDFPLIWNLAKRYFVKICDFLHWPLNPHACSAISAFATIIRQNQINSKLQNILVIKEVADACICM